MLAVYSNHLELGLPSSGALEIQKKEGEGGPAGAQGGVVLLQNFFSNNFMENNNPQGLQ